MTTKSAHTPVVVAIDDHFDGAAVASANLVGKVRGQPSATAASGSEGRGSHHEGNEDGENTAGHVSVLVRGDSVLVLKEK